MSARRISTSRRSAHGWYQAARRTALLLLSGLIVASGAIVATHAQSASAARTTSVDARTTFVAEASQRFGIPTAWIIAVMRAESAGEVRAISAAGAMGLMQIMPATWADLRARYELGRDPYDPRDNILAGAAYLREMWDRYSDVAAMLAAYNAGPARYDEHRAKGLPLPAETRAYVASLVPVLRGERPSKIALVASRPLDWREAAIFVAQYRGVSNADRVSTSRSSDVVHSLLPVASRALTSLPPTELFVARTDRGDRP